jgi:NADPH:quinone reductase-like Zn-dependent oxidoreductase
MKSWWIVSDHSKSWMEAREVPAPKAEKGQVVVKMHAAGLNRGEITVGGAVHGGPEKLGGTEGAGVVSAVGEGVTAFKVGDRVFGRIRGTFAEYGATFAHQLMPMPQRLTWEQAAGVPAAYTTAYEMLVMFGRLRRGEWLLVPGASSGVGVACIQEAKVIGANVIGLSGSSEKLEKLKAIGLDVGIATRKPDFAGRVKEATGGKGADLVTNLVGGTLFAECIRSMARRGRLAVVGYVDGSLKAELDLNAVHAGRLEIFGVSNQQVTQEERAAAVSGFARDMLPALADGRITPVIDRVYAFDEVPQAKARMESNAQVGKIVVRIA